MNAVDLLKKLQKFELNEEVRFSIKRGDDTGIVVQILITAGNIMYKVVWSDKSTNIHYESELKKITEKP